MAHTTPIVRHRGEGFALNLPISSGEEVFHLPVGVPAWYDWLEQNRAFRFESPSGSFSARREQRPGGWYWYASRRLQGKLHIAYLGRSREIDAARLTQIGRQLTGERMLIGTQELSAPEAASVFNTAAENMLLLTKLSCPRPRTDLLPRPHLVTCLEQCRYHTLTLLSTPAGFGKTTLLGEWLRQTILPVSWLSLDEQDNDPIRFWRYILAALGQLRPSLNAAVTPLLRQPGSSTLQVALITLLNELAILPQELCLVLDDYHLIREPEIHRSLAFLLEHLPAQFHLLLASRSEPPLPLSGLRATNEMLELRETKLRFTEQEALTFLRQTTNLSMEAMKLLARAHRGLDCWPPTRGFLFTRTR